MALNYPDLLQDLAQESDWLLKAVSALSESDWLLDTPAAGWNIKDQIGHLAFFDDATCLAVSDPDQFRSHASELMALGTDFPAVIATGMHLTSAPDVLDHFTSSRRRVQELLSTSDPAFRIPWYGPDMSIASKATARLMETWAHGQDVYDALGLTHPLGDGLRSIAHLGVRTFAFAHLLHGRVVPAQEVRVELTSPDGSQVWTWGPPDAENKVVGPAVDFVLTVTQRRHISQTCLSVTGPVANGWMEIAQIYAGPPTAGHPLRP